MVRKLLPISFLILGVTLESNAQGKSRQVADCRKIVVQDSDRRSFDDRSSFTVDVDGDDRPDTLIPRTYIVKNKRRPSGKTDPEVGEQHWISFDARTSRGHIFTSFFRYNYGTNEADLWVYAFVACRINKESRPALLFYSGDDTSRETMVLVKMGKVFKVHSREESSL